MQSCEPQIGGRRRWIAWIGLVLTLLSGAAWFGLVAQSDQRSTARNRVVRRERSPSRSPGHRFWPRLAVAASVDRSRAAGLLAADFREKHDSGGFLKLAIVSGCAEAPLGPAHGHWRRGAPGQHSSDRRFRASHRRGRMGRRLAAARFSACSRGSSLVGRGGALGELALFRLRDCRSRRAPPHRRNQYVVSGGERPGR